METSKEKKKGNRSLFDEPTKMVTVRLAASVFETLDVIVKHSKGKYADRSDLLRALISQGLSRWFDEQQK